MRAIVTDKYGSPDILQFKEVAKPIPKENEVLIKIQNASVNAGDWHLLRGDPFLVRFMFGFFKPKFKILGSDISGIVEAVGKEVKQFKPGDEIFGDISVCGFGAFAEYVSIPENAIVLKPSKISFEEAAAFPVSSVTALQALRDKGKIQSGQKVLINGASGGVGTFAVQIAKYFGAEVTAVCSTNKVEMVQSIGADHIIDYKKEDFTKTNSKFDLIVAANGFTPIKKYKGLLNPKGVYVMVGGSMKQMTHAMILGPFMSKKGGQQFGNFLSKPNTKDLIFMAELLESGKVKPVIDRRYKLSDVPNAIRYLEDGHAVGKVIIDIN